MVLIGMQLKFVMPSYYSKRMWFSTSEVSQENYSIRSILVATNIDVSRHIVVLDTSILMSSNMNRRDYFIYSWIAWTNHVTGQFG
jgi:hypothetical protein